MTIKFLNTTVLTQDLKSEQNFFFVCLLSAAHSSS